MKNKDQAITADEVGGASALPVEAEAVRIARARLAPGKFTERRHNHTQEGVPTMEGRTVHDKTPPLDMRSKSSPSHRRDEEGNIMKDSAGKDMLEHPPELKRSVPKSYAEGEFYRVQLAKAIEVAGQSLIPADIHTLEGSVCEANAASIFAAEKV